jgi:hypothetical protein
MSSPFKDEGTKIRVTKASDHQLLHCPPPDPKFYSYYLKLAVALESSNNRAPQTDNPMIRS